MQENSKSEKPKRKINKPKKYQTTDSSDDGLKAAKKRKESTRIDEMKSFFDETKAIADDDEEKEEDDVSNESEADETDTSDDDESVGNDKNNEKVISNTIKKVKDVNASNKNVQSTQKLLPRTSNLHKGNNSAVESSEILKEYLDLFCKAVENKVAEQFIEMQQYVEEKFVDIKGHIDNKMKEVSNSFKQGTDEMDLTLTPPDCFPFKTLEDFQAFEQDADKQKRAKQYFILWGGHDLKTATRQFLKEAMSDDLAMSFKWWKNDKNDTENNDPQNQKILFHSKLNQVICLACLKIFDGMAVEDYSVAMQASLRAAKQRYRDKKKRDQNRERQPADPLQLLRDLQQDHNNS